MQGETAKSLKYIFLHMSVCYIILKLLNTQAKHIKLNYLFDITEFIVC